MESDASYFRRRAEEEFEAAASTASPDARAVHFDLAGRYAQLAAAIEEATDKLGPLPEPFSDARSSHHVVGGHGGGLIAAGDASAS
jgi:hypothetical protein